jgi:ATPase subunit of ABC transporter with duplicated ATPase domains
VVKLCTSIKDSRKKTEKKGRTQKALQFLVPDSSDASERSISTLPSANHKMVMWAFQVVGDDRTVLQAVLDTDTERTALLAEEAALNAELGREPAAGAGAAEPPLMANGPAAPAGGDKSARLSAVYKRMEEIDADGAEARAAAILAGLSFLPDMQVQTRDVVFRIPG